MRGILSISIGSDVSDRITPACAGNTLVFVTIFLGGKDHPRLCGEYGIISSMRGTLLGSPPPVRGIHRIICLSSRNPRITPACAGNTYVLRDGIRGYQDHPRLCGEYSLYVATNHRFVGSPPPVRGIPLGTGERNEHARITPACAGNTWLVLST